MDDESQSKKVKAAINEAIKVIGRADQTIAKAQRTIESNREILKHLAARDGKAKDSHAPAD